MEGSGYAIGLAVPHDIPGILDLQERNLRCNGGTLSVRFSRNWFEEAIGDMPVIVARKDAKIVGYAVSTTLAAQAREPIVQAMLCAYKGSGAAYMYGPICVAEEHRGWGVAIAMFEERRGRLPEREGISFIRADNTASRKVHIGMGLREVAEFALNDTAYVVISYQG